MQRGDHVQGFRERPRCTRRNEHEFIRYVAWGISTTDSGVLQVILPDDNTLFSLGGHGVICKTDQKQKKEASEG